MTKRGNNNSPSMLKGTIFFISLIIVGYLLKVLFVDDVASIENFKSFLGERQHNAHLYFIILASVATMVGLPRQAMAFIAGYSFGFFEGVLYSTIAATFGCIACFYYARYFAKKYIHDKYQSKVAHIDKFLKDDTFIKTMIIRFLPVGSNLLTNLVAGVSNVKKRHFIGGSFIGYIPQMAIFSLSGSGVSIDSNNQLIASALLLVISLVLGSWLYKKYKAEQFVQPSGLS